VTVFTGIVEEMGTAVETGTRMRVRVGLVGSDSGPGSSIAVNGVCLTVVARDEDAGGRAVLAFDLADETLARTSLGRVRAGDPMNLERPVAAGDRLGGHIVQGHDDGVGTVGEVREVETGREMTIRVPSSLARFVAEKGSIAVDGVSLTVTGVKDDSFGVALIPFTLEATTLGARAPGDEVNLEVDVIARYVERLLEVPR